MIKFFRHIRKSLIQENKTFCHSALDAEIEDSAFSQSTINEILNQVQDDNSYII